MRILIVTDEFIPSTDGIVIRLKEAIRYFHRQGHQVAIIAPNQGVDSFDDAPVLGIRTQRMIRNRKRPIAIPNKKIYEYMQDFEPDVVHVAGPLFMGASAIKAAVELRLPLVVSYHTNQLRFMGRYKLDKIYMRYLIQLTQLQNAKGTAISLCTSHEMRQYLMGCGAGNVHVLKRGVDSEKRHPKYYSKEMRQYLCRGQIDKKLLLVVGRLNRDKGVETLLPLMKRRKDVTLAIVGDGVMRDELERKFTGTATLFTGFMQGKSLQEAYASADAFVFPSVKDSVGLTILEAMASGLPVIAAHSTLTDKQYSDRRDTLLYTPGDEESIDRAINCLDDEKLVQRLRIISRIEAEASSWEDASEQLLDYYHIVRTHATQYN